MDEQTRPVLRIVRGEPDAAEIAALTAVLATAGGGEPAPDVAPRSGWARPTDLVRAPVRHGPDGWRASARPGW